MWGAASSFESVSVRLSNAPPPAQFELQDALDDFKIYLSDTICLVRNLRQELLDFTTSDGRAEAEPVKERLPRRTRTTSMLMVFDTQTKQFVGSGCYVVESLPTPGAVRNLSRPAPSLSDKGILNRRGRLIVNEIISPSVR